VITENLTRLIVCLKYIKDVRFNVQRNQNTWIKHREPLCSLYKSNTIHFTCSLITKTVHW
jgi:uncharacterized protein YecT (DUF1311 family)